MGKYGKDRHHVETAGLSTAGSVGVSVDPLGAVELQRSRADLFVTAPDEFHDYRGFAALDVRLTPAEAQELVSRIMVAMACAESEAS
jgi:hypothetical protein